MSIDKHVKETPQVKKLIKDIMKGIKRIEDKVEENKHAWTKHIKDTYEYDYLIRYGIEGFKKKILGEEQPTNAPSSKELVYHNFYSDSSLRYPHKKILEYLHHKYDHQAHAHDEANFNKIVKECHLGKNKAREYLKHLEDNGHIIRRDDGYRVWYRLQNES